MTEKQFQKDEVIFRQGEEGNTFYQVIEGAVGIVVSYDGKEKVQLSKVTKDQFFGEMAVIESAPRSADAIALEDGTQVMEYSADELRSCFENNPETVELLMKTLSKRLRDLTLEYDEAKKIAEINVDKKPDEEFIRGLRKYRFFHKNRKRQLYGAEVDREEERRHSDGFSKDVVSYRKGTVICREGDLVPCTYDIHWGRVGIYSNYGKPNQVELTILAANNFFGEMGMVDNEPRSATAVALDDETTVEIIHPEDLAELFEKNPNKVDMILRHLSSRLRKLTAQYYDVCEKIAEKAGTP